MKRERVLKIVLVVVGLLFTAGVIPLSMFFLREPAVAMIMSIYVTLGIFLLLAVRDPAANRSLIAFAGWANLAHAGVMAAQEYRPCDRAPRTRGSGSVRSRRGYAGRFGSHEAVCRESLCCRRIGQGTRELSISDACCHRSHKIRLGVSYLRAEVQSAGQLHRCREFCDWTGSDGMHSARRHSG